MKKDERCMQTLPLFAKKRQPDLRLVWENDNPRPSLPVGGKNGKRKLKPKVPHVKIYRSESGLTLIGLEFLRKPHFPKGARYVFYDYNRKVRGIVKAAGK